VLYHWNMSLVPCVQENVMKATKEKAVIGRFRAAIEPEQLWYVADARIRTKAAADSAIELARWIETRREGDSEPGEQALFSGMHTCAYHAARRRRARPITQSERDAWSQRWQIIREYIVERNLGLVYSMISRFTSSNVDEDDLLSDALFGLTRAVDRFDPWRGFKFSTYACNVIARALMRRGRQESNYRRLFPVQHDISFERPDSTPDSQTELYVERLHRALHDNLGALTDLESSILSQRFPTERGERLTFKEIGDAIGLSKERVRQIQNIALNKLREVLSEDPVLK
jgi:RNA polymerase sigma factor (sigma-70 family)